METSIYPTTQLPIYRIHLSVVAICLLSIDTSVFTCDDSTQIAQTQKAIVIARNKKKKS